MVRSVAFALAAAALAAAALAGAAAADDPVKKKPDGPPDWGTYVAHVTLTGEVEKVTADGFVLRVPELVRGGNGKPEWKPKSYDLAFHDNGLVRFAKLPPKLDAKGKKVAYTDKERKELKSPPTAPGYAADRADLAAGAVVEVQLLRPKNVPAAKLATLVDTDFKVKYAVIQGDPVRREPDKKADPKKGDDPKKGEAKKDAKKE